MSAEKNTLKHVDPSKVKPGVAKVTFESEDGLSKAVVLVDQNFQENKLRWQWEGVDLQLMERDKHEPYMLLALSFVGSLFPPEK